VLEYQRLKKDRRKLLALTGLTPKEFGMLLPVFAEVYEQARVDTTQRGTVRRRAVGGGRKGQLRSAEQKLLFILVYQKAYPLQALLGEVFELSQSRVNHWVHYLLPLLKQALEALEVMPERRPRHFAHQAGGKREAGTLINEGTDRRRQRPQAEPETSRNISKEFVNHHMSRRVVMGKRSDVRRTRTIWPLHLTT